VSNGSIGLETGLARTPAPARISRGATCPRCAYDLSGTIATWRDACPMTGICSECGLEVSWSDLLGAQRLPGWSFEHARGIRSLLSTLWVAWRPRRIWRLLRMDHPIRPARLLALALLLLLASHAVVATDGFVRAWMDGSLGPQQGTIMLGPGGAVTRAPPPTVTLEQRATYAGWVALEPYRTHHLRFGGVVYATTPARVSPFAWFTPLLLLFMALGFLTLPASLRRAKVRPAHIARILVYSLTLVPLTWAMWWIVRPDIQDWGGWYALAELSMLRPPGAVAILVATLLATFWYWRVACREYLRLSHATGVAAALTIIGLLASMCLGLLFT